MCGGSMSIGYSAINSKTAKPGWRGGPYRRGGQESRRGRRKRPSLRNEMRLMLTLLNAGGLSLMRTIRIRLRVAPKRHRVFGIGSRPRSGLVELAVAPAAFLHRKPHQGGSAH